MYSGDSYKMAAAAGHCLTSKNWRNLRKQKRLRQKSLKNLAQSLFFCNFARILSFSLYKGSLGD